MDQVGWGVYFRTNLYVGCDVYFRIVEHSVGTGKLEAISELWRGAAPQTHRSLLGNRFGVCRPSSLPLIATKKPTQDPDRAPDPRGARGESGSGFCVAGPQGSKNRRQIPIPTLPEPRGPYQDLVWVFDCYLIAGGLGGALGF